MANFKTHISTSAILGIGYGAIGHTIYQIPLPSSVLAAGLCTVAGILPDVDADRGHSLREVMAFLAAVVPLLLLHRASHLELPHETLVLLGALIYLLIRFVLTNLIRRSTIHRGMWHSIPAAAIAGLAAFWLCDCQDLRRQIYKAAAVSTGFIWHLVLDEIYAVDTSGYQTRVKRSFGTALKMFGKKPFANVFVYGLLFVLGALVMNDQRLPTATATPQPQETDRHDQRWHYGHGHHNGDAPAPYQPPVGGDAWIPVEPPPAEPSPLVIPPTGHPSATNSRRGETLPLW